MTSKLFSGSLADNINSKWIKYAIIIFVILIGWYFAHLFMQQKAKSESRAAATIYSSFLKASTESSPDLIKSNELALSLQKDYPKTLYASFASLLQAKLAYKKANNINQALNYLNWIINNSSDSGLVSIARLHIAKIYNDENKPQLAIAELLKDHSAQFDTAYYIARGDVYTSMGNNLKAHDAYVAALTKLQNNDPALAQSVRLKLLVLGK